MKQRPKTLCEICGRLIANSGFQRHLCSHQNGNFDKNKVKYQLDHDDPYCKYCNKYYEDSNKLLQHEIRCPNNSERIPVDKYLAIGRKHRNKDVPVWNKGLTAETDERIAKGVATFKNNYRTKHPELYTELAIELSTKLDDDGKLYEKYSNRKSSTNTRHFIPDFLLTFEEFCKLMDEAGIKSSDLGYTGNCYDLARYNDTGDYEMGNCRFITHSENLKERKLSKEALEKMSSNAKNRRPLTEEEKAIRVQKFLNSDYIKRLKEEAAIRESERRSKLDPRFSGEHNSQLGTHWITNGVENKKLHPGDKMPEGFHLGRVNATKKMPQ